MRMAQSTKTYYDISVGTLQHALWNVANNVEVCAIIVLKKSAHIMAKLFAYIPGIYHVPNHSLPATSNHKIIPQKSFSSWIWSNLNQFYCAWKLWLFCFIHSIIVLHEANVLIHVGIIMSTDGLIIHRWPPMFLWPKGWHIWRHQSLQPAWYLCQHGRQGYPNKRHWHMEKKCSEWKCRPIH